MYLQCIRSGQSAIGRGGCERDAVGCGLSVDGYMCVCVFVMLRSCGLQLVCTYQQTLPRTTVLQNSKGHKPQISVKSRCQHKCDVHVYLPMCAPVCCESAHECSFHAAANVNANGVLRGSRRRTGLTHLSQRHSIAKVGHCQLQRT